MFDIYHFSEFWQLHLCIIKERGAGDDSNHHQWFLLVTCPRKERNHSGITQYFEEWPRNTSRRPWCLSSCYCYKNKGVKLFFWRSFQCTSPFQNMSKVFWNITLWFPCFVFVSSRCFRGTWMKEIEKVKRKRQRIVSFLEFLPLERKMVL